MPETTTTEAPPDVEDQADAAASPAGPEQYPPDHPLVKRLEAMKAELKEAKPKVRRLAELEDAAKTQAEKDAERVAKAEAEAATVPEKVSAYLRDYLVDFHSIDKDRAALFLTGTTPELLLKQVTALVADSGKPRRNQVPREGENPSAAGSSDLKDFTSQLFGDQ